MRGKANSQNIQGRFNELLNIVKQEVFLSFTSNERSIFLCGGASKQQRELRFQIGETIESLQSQYVYTVHYPEFVFTEILYGHHKTDLLSLENYLAKNVDSIVVPLQSPGTFAELGAFVNNKTLRKKLIVLSDQKYMLDRSFINLGPIALLKAQRKDAVIHCDFNTDKDNLKSLSYKITEVSRQIFTEFPSKHSLDNPIAALLFYQCCVYLFDPISIENFRSIVKTMCGFEEENKYIQDTILASVISRGGVRVLGNNYLSLSTDEFSRILEKKGFSKIQISRLMRFLREERPSAMDLYYRRRGVDFGDGPAVYRQ